MRYWILLGFQTLLALLMAGGALAANPPRPLLTQGAILQELSAKEKKILQELEALSKQINQKREEIEALAEEIAKKELILRHLNEEVHQKEKLLARLNFLFRERLKRLATLGKIGWVNLLLAPQDIATFFRRQEYVSLILYHDQELAQKIKKEREELANKREYVAREKEQLEELKRQYENQLVVLENLKREKENLLEEVKRNKRLYAETLKMLEQAYAAIAQMAEELKRTRAELEATREEVEKAKQEARKKARKGVPPPLLEVKGMLPPPVPGEVIRFFGLNDDPLKGEKFFQPGITIAAPAGSPVKAPYAGKIIKISYLRQKGFVVFIDHGYHFLSVIGGLSKVTKGLGAEVATGEVIGEVGESPYEESGVYYELRYRGKPQDPLAWLDTSQLKLMR